MRLALPRIGAVVFACAFPLVACSSEASPSETRGAFETGSDALPPEDAEFTLLSIDEEPIPQALPPFTLSIYVNNGGVLVLIGFDGCNVVGGPIVAQDDDAWIVELGVVTGLLGQEAVIVNRRDATWLNGREAIDIKYQPVSETLLVTELEGTRSTWAFDRTGGRHLGDFGPGPAPVESTEAVG